MNTLKSLGFLWLRFVTYYNEINTTELALLYRNTSIDMSQGRITIHNDGKEIAYRLALDISKEGHLSGPKSELWAWIVSNAPEPQSQENGLDWVNSILPEGVEARPSVTLRIGARMGKPEGSKPREMKPAFHSLFPVGFKVGSKRLLRDAAAKNVKIECGLKRR